jgi:enoyl-CoA hydratase/carnithine racemase
MSGLVTINIDNYIADVRLNRPDKYNALSPEMFQAIIEAGETLKGDSSIRVVVLSGNGKGFCAGLDFSSFQQMGSGGEEGESQGSRSLFERPAGTPANFAQYTGFVWKEMAVPVIAAVHGVAFGGGLQIALGADIRLASPDARFSVMEIKWGLVPDMSGTQTLRDLVRLDVAKELTFTGRQVPAEEAAKLGLVTRVCDDPLKEAMEMAAVIAGKSPDAIASDKQLLETAWRASAEEGLKLEESLQKALISSPNQVEAVMANFENRPPNFKDRSN